MNKPKVVYFEGSKVCLNCGASVQLVRTKEGKSYVGEASRNSIHGGTFSPSHRCDLYSKDDASLNFQARMIEQGRMIEGQTVRVFKGRKVPIGLESTINFIMPSVYGEYASISVDGYRVNISLNNLQVVKVDE